jgi:hypothetical protein
MAILQQPSKTQTEVSYEQIGFNHPVAVAFDLSLEVSRKIPGAFR